MSHEPFFAQVDGPVPFGGHEARDPLSFRWYDADRVVGGATMAERLRFAVAYWHSFAADGSDMFGQGTWDRPWIGAVPEDALAAAGDKMAAAFEFVAKLGAPFVCFHDRDIAPEGASFAESRSWLHRMGDEFGEHMERTGIKLLWGTANLFSHPRYRAGAATNPDPEVFAYAAAQVADAMELTKRLGGANYVLWGGREGYDSLLVTDYRRELDQLARFLHMAVEHKHRIDFEGPLLIEPKPFEPLKHHYDRDVATVVGFLERHDLLGEVLLNVEVNHATLAGHDAAHEVATAAALGAFCSIDANAGDDRLGWDVDRFPVSVEAMSLVMLEVLRAGGFTTGGLNFDARLRRQSTDRVDLFHAHIGGMDTMAHALLVADELIDDPELGRLGTEGYAGWNEELGRSILGSEVSFAELADRAAGVVEPQGRSMSQERAENLVAAVIDRVR
ncbi:MAG: xylose isomerase [Microthrixaceae bacterium]